MTVFPQKTETPLIVYPNAVMIFPVPLQVFQSIGRRNPQVVERLSFIQHKELPENSLLDISGKFPGNVPFPDPFGFRRLEALYHDSFITHCVMEGKQRNPPFLKAFPLCGNRMKNPKKSIQFLNDKISVQLERIDAMRSRRVDILPSLSLRSPRKRKGRGFLPANSPSFDGDGSADLKGQAADSEVFAPEQALRACPALRIFFAALTSAFSA